MLLLDDHENLCGGPDAPVAVSRAVWTALTETLLVTKDDNVIIGLSDFGVKNLMESFPPNARQLVVGYGRDGADHALIRSVDPDHVATRFDSVVIASGDHIFASLALRLRSLGLLVCNVTTTAGRSSRDLAKACQCRARLKVNILDRAVLSRLAASRAGTHGYEGQWIVRHVN
jgi:hypothetical protein